MSRKALLILAAVAIVAAVLAYLGQRPDRGAGPAGTLVGQPLLAALEADINDVERVTVLGPGDETEVTLERGPDGWAVAEQDGYPADVATIRKVLVALGEAHIIEEKTSDPAFYDRLGVEPLDAPDATGTGIRIATADMEFPTVILGSASGNSYRFARLADQAKSVLIDRNPEPSQDPTQWVLPEIIDIRSARVQRVEISHADGERLTISKATRDDNNFSVENVPEGRELQYPTVANVVGNALRELRLEQAARLESPPPDAAATSEFWTFDGLVVTATGMTVDGENWVRFAARFDADQALRFADSEVDGSVAGETAAGDSAADSDAAAEAEEINARLGQWRFRIPSYQYEQMTRRMSDLLKPLSEAE